VTLYLEYNAAGSLALDLPARADAAPTWSLVDFGGATLAAGTCARDAVDTTLAAPAAAGATAITLASGTGVAVGTKYLLGGPESGGGERVTVKAVAGAAVTLVRPLRLARAGGDACQGTRVTCAIPSSATKSIARHDRLEIAWSVATVAQPVYRADVDIVRYVTTSTVTSFDDVVDLDPVSGKRLPAGTWFPAVRDEAWAMLMDRVAARVDPGAVVSSGALARAHRYLIRALLAETAGDGWDAYRKTMAQRFAEELEAALGAAAVDDDQDGVIDPREGWRRGFVVERA